VAVDDGSLGEAHRGSGPESAGRSRLAAIAREWALDVALPFVVTRSVLLFALQLSLTLLPVSRFVPPAWTVTGPNPLIDALSRWDATHYLSIAARGYATGSPTDAAFFPLYPAIVRVLGTLTGLTDHDGLALAAVLVANIVLIVAVTGLVEVARQDLDAAAARRAGWMLLAFPMTLFLSAGYAESLFLALSIWAYFACRHDRWLTAGTLAAGAALTRPFGALIVLPLAVEWAMQWRRGTRTATPLVAFGMVVLGLAIYVAFLARQYGDPLAFVHAQADWGRSLTPPWTTLARFFSEPITLVSGEHAFVDLAFTVLLGVVAAWSWSALRPGLALFTTSLFLVPLLTGSMLSMPRFALTSFPVFLVLALAARDERLERILLVVGAGLAGLYTALFAQWYWAS